MATTLAGPVSRPWRRFLRFSVRGLIVLVLVTGAGLGWVVRSARIQREAVAAILMAGGCVDYDRQWEHGQMVSRPSPDIPQWLLDRLGEDFFYHVTRVGDLTQRMSDAELGHIGNLTKLQSLRLYNANERISDIGMANFAGLSDLRTLIMFAPAVTDAGLAHLRGLTRLESLILEGTQVTDAGVKDLQQALPHLKITR